MRKWAFFFQEDTLFYVLMDKERMIECRLESEESSLVGRIYLASVETIAPELHAAFLRIGEEKCFFYLPDLSEIIFVKQARPGKLSVGDEILVQIRKDALKTKEAAAESLLEMQGRFCVISSSLCHRGVSKKIKDPAERDRLKALITEASSEGIGILMRTNAEGVEEEKLKKEISFLQEQMKNLLSSAPYRTCPALLWSPEPAWVRLIRSLNVSAADELVTDHEGIFQTLKQIQADYPEGKEIPCRLYEDRTLPLANCLRVPVLLEKALRPQVWLNSGAYLVIEPTEALTAIDVNTGKSDGKKKGTEDFFFDTNMEAAEEVMHQIRLRNLSGMILVDFINMKEEKHAAELLSFLSKLAADDPVKTSVIDMTPLGLVEITRKKERETLAGQYQKFTEKRRK